MTSNFMNIDASSDLIQESPTAKNKKLNLINNIIFNKVLSQTQKILQQRGTMPK